MTIEILAPAKINLGLEVLGKRTDGFHDIATVFQTISVFDRLRLTPSDSDEVRIINSSFLIDANLATQALQHARSNGFTRSHWRIDLEKRIPIAAGLGGASADAAAVLIGLASQSPRAPGSLASDALALGSDVPFLLAGGAALAHGRGEILAPLPPLRDCWLVLASPEIGLERKTSRLYGALEPTDFSGGTRVERVADALRAGQLPDQSDLHSAFAKPLERIAPTVQQLRSAFIAAGADFVALTGAGPTHYTITATLHDAIALAASLTEQRLQGVRTLIACPIPHGPIKRLAKPSAGGGAL